MYLLCSPLLDPHNIESVILSFKLQHSEKGEQKA
jgi:hypothetical protein